MSALVRFVKGVRGRIAGLKSNRSALAATTTLVGLGAGLGIGYWQWHTTPSTATERTVASLRQVTKSAPSSAPASTQELRLASGLERALQAVDTDLAEQKLTKDQASTLKERLKQAASERQVLLDADDDDGKQSQTLKQTWRKWANEHKLSYRYFTKL